MDGTPEDLNTAAVAAAPGRPRDLALLLLAIGTAPPRQRARDQQADLAGGELRRGLLDGVARLDPEPDEASLVATLAALVVELGTPPGPARAAASQFLQEWRDAQVVPGFWSWLLAEALERSGRRFEPRGRSRPEGERGSA